MTGRGWLECLRPVRRQRFAGSLSAKGRKANVLLLFCRPLSHGWVTGTPLMNKAATGLPSRNCWLGGGYVRVPTINQAEATRRSARALRV